MSELPLHARPDVHSRRWFLLGVLCLSLGIPKEYFTATFAASRAFGWLAHIVEQRSDNRIIRPAALYVGPAPREPGNEQQKAG